MWLFGSPAARPPASPGSSLRFGVAHTSGRRVVPSDRPADAWAHPRNTFRDKNCELVSPGWAVDLYTLCSAVMRAFSSVGRALPLQGRCRGFESLNAHHTIIHRTLDTLRARGFFVLV
jgi:hypothetical protein